MGFKHLYLTVALLFVFNRSLHEVQASIAMTSSATHPAGLIAPMHETGIGEDGKAVALVELPYKVHDGNEQEFKSLRQGIPINLHAVDVPTTTAGVFDLVRLGLGVFFQRAQQIKTKYWHHLDELKYQKTTRELYLCKKFKWEDAYSKVVEPAMIDQQHVNDVQLINFSPAEFPVKLPAHMQHQILTVRVPLITDKCIEPLPGEVKPKDYDYWEQHIEQVKHFILAHDFMGTNTVAKGQEVDDPEFGKLLMPTRWTREALKKLRSGKYANAEEAEEPKEVKKQVQKTQNTMAKLGSDEDADAEKPKDVEAKKQEEGKDEVVEKFQGHEYRTLHGAVGLETDPAHLVSMKAAMQWFTRHIHRLLKAKYPGKEYAFFRVNAAVRSHDLEEIHIFLPTTAGAPDIIKP